MKLRKLWPTALKSAPAFSSMRKKNMPRAALRWHWSKVNKLPTPEELRVDEVAFLLGLAEAVGELRRYLLDKMRTGDLSRGEEFLSDMDDIYNVLVTLDFPDAITHGLRRTTDAMRGVLEKTRSDLTLTIRQKALEDTLSKPKRKTKKTM